jgi:hypothetical protein
MSSLTPVASVPTAAILAPPGEVALCPPAPAALAPSSSPSPPGELVALQARCAYLSQELNRRGLAIHQQAARLEENKVQITALEKRLAKQESAIKRLQKVVASAKEWQQRGWMKRAFHKWRAPGSEGS